MNWLRGSQRVSMMLACLMLNTACSMVSEESGGIPEIQGVWRYSDGIIPHVRSSLTYEFQQGRFRVSGYPNIYAYGNYAFKMSEHGGYQVALVPEEGQGFEPRTIQIQPTGGRILLIDHKIYRRILRH